MDYQVDPTDLSPENKYEQIPVPGVAPGAMTIYKFQISEITEIFELYRKPITHYKK